MSLITFSFFYCILYIFTLLNGVVFSLCGKNELPYSFEVTSSNNLILLCSEPKCLKSNILNSAFCESDYSSTNCTKPGEWPAGIRFHVTDTPNDPPNLLCCNHKAMKSAKFFGVYDIQKGQIFSGGELRKNGKLKGFDYISNIVKEVPEGNVNNQSAIYKIFVNRLPCKRSTKKVKHYYTPNLLSARSRLYQAPIVAVNNASSPPTPITFDGCTREPNSQEEEEEDPEEFDSDNSTSSAAPVSFRTAKLFQAPLLIVENDGGVNTAVAQQGALIPPSGLQANIPGTNLLRNIPLDTAAFFGACDPENTDTDFSGCDRNDIFDEDIRGEVPNNVPEITNNNFPFLRQPDFPPAVERIPIPDDSFSRFVPPTPPPVTPPPPMTLQCFSGDTKVILLNHTSKRIDELEIGDWILSAGENKVGYAKVLSWLHKMPKSDAEFLRIGLENGKELKITRKHFIYKTPCQAKNNATKIYGRYLFESIQAEKIQISDCLLSLNLENKFVPTRITKIDTILDSGIYAPLTDNGNLIVNGIFASCYSDIDNESLQFSVWILKANFERLMEFGRMFYNLIFQSSPKNEIDLIPGIQSFVEIVKTVL